MANVLSSQERYYTHIDFNDDAITNIMELLRSILNKDHLYSSVVTPDYYSRVKTAFDKGIDIILKTQIVVAGKPTVWCAQHDENTLLPAKARSYELPSFSGYESVGIVKFLMEIPDPRRKLSKQFRELWNGLINTE